MVLMVGVRRPCNGWSIGMWDWHGGQTVAVGLLRELCLQQQQKKSNKKTRPTMAPFGHHWPVRETTVEGKGVSVITMTMGERERVTTGLITW
jgi:hypothetical protein